MYETYHRNSLLTPFRLCSLGLFISFCVFPASCFKEESKNEWKIENFNTFGQEIDSFLDNNASVPGTPLYPIFEKGYVMGRQKKSITKTNPGKKGANPGKIGANPGKIGANPGKIGAKEIEDALEEIFGRKIKHFRSNDRTADNGMMKENQEVKNMRKYVRSKEAASSDANNAGNDEEDEESTTSDNYIETTITTLNAEVNNYFLNEPDDDDDITTVVTPTRTSKHDQIDNNYGVEYNENILRQDDPIATTNEATTTTTEATTTTTEATTTTTEATTTTTEATTTTTEATTTTTEATTTTTEATTTTTEATTTTTAATTTETTTTPASTRTVQPTRTTAEAATTAETAKSTMQQMNMTEIKVYYKDETTSSKPPTTTRANDGTTTTRRPGPATTRVPLSVGPNLDIPALLDIIANLTYDYDSNLTQEINETLLKLYTIPTCPTPTTTEPPTTTTTTEEPPPFFNISGVVVAKCFVCGLEESEIPRKAHCADAFAGDFLPLVPIDPTARGEIARFRKYCRYNDVNNYKFSDLDRRSIFGRWTGGCSVRWVDLSGVYTQRSCRNRDKATLGQHFVSKRMAKLEMALRHVDNGCIISPMASLVPFSRGVSLYARFHACVCTGNWCNAAHYNAPWISNIMFFTVLLYNCS